MSLSPRRFRLAAIIAAALTALATALLAHAPSAHATSRSAHATSGADCSSVASSTRDAANPLLLSPAPPASDPLRGAKLWVAGPSHSTVAGAILHLLGIDTSQGLNTGHPYTGFPTTESWAAFAAELNAVLPNESSTVQSQVRELEKIGEQPAAIRVSASSGGGSPSAVLSQVQSFVCNLAPEDPGAVMQLSTYFLQPTLGHCATTAQIDAYAPRFKAQINAVASGIGDNPMIIFAEEDAIGVSHCMVAKHSLPAWESLLRYEVTTLEALPHTAVYLEGGYSDSQDARYAASVLNPSGVQHIQGFFTNDTHFAWDTSELRYSEQISDLTGGAHFIINTSDNGRGPLLNHSTVSQGVEQLCNPPGRGLGIAPTTHPTLPAAYANAKLDGFLWTFTPGFSVGTCNGGPPGGQYWTALAVSLGSHANNQLGPGYPSQPW